MTKVSALEQVRSLKAYALPLLLVLGVCNVVVSLVRCGRIPQPPPPVHSPEPLIVERPLSTTFEGRLPAPHEPTTEEKYRTIRDKNHVAGNPALLIYVGPSYTHASQLEQDLRAISSELARDKVVLAHGTAEDLLTDSSCHQSVNEARMEFTKNKKQKLYPAQTYREALKAYLAAQVPCWKHATAALRLHKEKGQSLIFINEQLSKEGSNGRALTLDLEAMETLADEWNIEFLVGYRRYSAWLPDVVEDFSRARRAAKKLGEASTELQPLFPDIVRGSLARINATYTDTLFEKYQQRQSGVGEAKIPVRLFNVHAGPMGKTMACTILQSAQHACKAAEHLKEVRSIASKSQPAQMDDFYEFIVGVAAERHAYRKTTVTPEVAEIAVKYFWETKHAKAIQDLPVTCPTKTTLRNLLKTSLNYEKKLLPSFASYSADDHRREFWKETKQSNRFCHIDVRKLLHDVNFREYLRFIPKEVPKEMLPRTFREKARKNRKSVIRGGKFMGFLTTIRRRKPTAKVS